RYSGTNHHLRSNASTSFDVPWQRSGSGTAKQTKKSKVSPDNAYALWCYSNPIYIQPTRVVGLFFTRTEKTHLSTDPLTFKRLENRSKLHKFRSIQTVTELRFFSVRKTHSNVQI